MAIRRFREHAAAQNWFAVGIDLAIVVVGVFLGIQASNWNQSRIDRAEAAEYRSQIIENLRANEADASARTAYHLQVRAHAVATLEALQQPGSRPAEQFLIDAYQASNVWLRPLQRTAYDALSESGVASNIGDIGTQTELFAYYVLAGGFDTTARSTTAYRERVRRAMDLRAQEAIRNRCGDIEFTLPGGGEAPRLPKTCRLGLEPNLAERAAAKLAMVPELDQDLTRLIGDIDQKLALFARVSRRAAQLRGRLEAA